MAAAAAVLPHATLLYSSPRPRIILFAARVLALKSAVSLAAGAWVGRLALLPPDAGAAVLAALSAGAAPPAAVQLSAGFLVLSALSGAAARAIISRTVVRIERTPTVGGDAERDAADASPVSMPLAAIVARAAGAAMPDPRPPAGAATTIHVTTPSLFGRGEVTRAYASHALRGALPSHLLQGFRVPSTRRGLRALFPATLSSTFSERYLFPVEPHWVSHDIGALRKLLYADYFRSEERQSAAEEAATASALLEGIRGFGPFRVAQFADPRCAVHAQQRIEGGRTPPAPEDDAALWAADGTVWSSFVLPEPLSEADARRVELARRGGAGVGGVSAVSAALTHAGQLPSLRPLPDWAQVSGDDKAVEAIEKRRTAAAATPS